MAPHPDSQDDVPNDLHKPGEEDVGPNDRHTPMEEDPCVNPSIPTVEMNSSPSHQGMDIFLHVHAYISDSIFMFFKKDERGEK